MHGLYAITPEIEDTGTLAQRVADAIAGGARMVQYRHKTATPVLRRTQAEALLAVCRRAGVPLIINDDLALALELDADGVHLGRDDGDTAAARRQLGPRRLLGISCYNELDRAVAAQAAGADYLAFGAVYPSRIKPGAVHAPLALFATARARFPQPLVAIGGITADNARAVIDAGADALAVVSAVFDPADTRAAAARIAGLFAKTSA
ncbi:MAG: thiamine phosphate synthase [Burkholderiales bacterium]